MHDDPDDVLCRGCGSYAHPFLESCAVCGLERESLYEAATAAPDQGLATLPSDPRLAQDVAEVVLRYTLKLNSAPATSQLHEGLGVVADALSYRVRIGGDPRAGTERGHVEFGEANLVVRERNPAREVLRVPMDAILAVSAAAKDRRADTWAGLAFEGRNERTSLPPVHGNLVVAHATPTGVARLALANRGGLLAARARPDHYAILARWIGIVAAGAAERRWTAVGPGRHAHQLGLAAAPPGGWPDPVVEAPAAAASTVADALRLLEELRAARLVSDDEYGAKRREILGRI